MLDAIAAGLSVWPSLILSLFTSSNTVVSAGSDSFISPSFAVALISVPSSSFGEIVAVYFPSGPATISAGSVVNTLPSLSVILITAPGVANPSTVVLSGFSPMFLAIIEGVCVFCPSL